MKTALPVLLVAVFVTACSQRQKAMPVPGDSNGRTPSPSATTAPRVTPVQSHAGKVASVKPELRFVVVNFSLSGVPPEGTQMVVYRDGRKVADIRITGPSVGSNTAADITAGDVSVGDEVRSP